MGTSRSGQYIRRKRCLQIYRKMTHGERESVERLAIRIHLGTITRVHQLARILSDIERAYNAMYFFYDLSEAISAYLQKWPPRWRP